MAVQLTKAAAEHVQTMLAKRGHGIGLRLAVKQNGCSGFGYVVDYADAIDESDHVFTHHQVQVIVNQDSLAFLTGMEVDYVKENALNAGFEFRNPNAVNTCGCGESFNIK